MGWWVDNSCTWTMAWRDIFVEIEMQILNFSNPSVAPEDPELVYAFLKALGKYAGFFF